MTRATKVKQGLWCVAAAALVLWLCSKSSPLFAFNDWMDANIFYTMGKSLFSGKVLYRDVFDHKGPVLYLLYGVGWLLDGTGFTGVFLLEVAALGWFLRSGLQAAEQLAGKTLHPAWAVLPAALVASSRAFSHGGSAEEFLLPLLAVALCAMLTALQTEKALPLGTVCFQGFLAGCALWLKYTVLGYYLVWVAVLAVVYLRRGWYRALGRSCGVYLAGMALATFPWVLYFGWHGALTDWFDAYFYDNLFLYSGTGGGPVALVQHLWWTVRDGLPGMLLPALFLVWAVAARRRGIALVVCLLAAGLAGTSLMGGYLVYYGLVLAVFLPLGLAPLARLAGRFPISRRAGSAIAAAVMVGGGAFCWLVSPNAALRGRSAQDLPQRRFAARILQTPEATLLNYGTLDGGFYTATGLLPPCRYFCVTNMPLQDQWTQQDNLMKTGEISYVVALVGNLQDRFPLYHCIDQCSYDGGEGQVTWYLYRRQ